MGAENSSGIVKAIRWPLLALAVAGLGIGVAVALDRTAAREWALTIGAPALTVLLPVGLIWLVVAVIRHVAGGSGSPLGGGSRGSRSPPGSSLGR
jgi:hypothetical protein